MSIVTERMNHDRALSKLDEGLARIRRASPGAGTAPGHTEQPQRRAHHQASPIRHRDTSGFLARDASRVAARSAPAHRDERTLLGLFQIASGELVAGGRSEWIALRDALQIALDALLESDELSSLLPAAIDRRPELGADVRRLCDEFDAEIARLCGMLYLLEDPVTLRSIDRAWMVKQIDRMACELERLILQRDELIVQIYWQDEGGEGFA
jgi:hypothetical protein